MADRSSTGAAPEGADVLVHGHDERPRRRPRRLGGAVVLLVAVVLAGVGLAQQGAREPKSRPEGPAEELRLSLDGVVERARAGAAHGDLHVQVRNDGPDPVRLLSAGAGGWRLEVPDATTLAPGASTVLRLIPSPACSVLAEMRSTGRALLVEAVVGSGPRRAVVVDLAAADAPRLARLREPQLECAAGRSDAAAVVARDARALVGESGQR